MVKAWLRNGMFLTIEGCRACSVTSTFWAGTSELEEHFCFSCDHYCLYKSSQYYCSCTNNDDRRRGRDVPLIQTSWLGMLTS